MLREELAPKAAIVVLLALQEADTEVAVEVVLETTLV
jgi:hypothetical protein